MQQRTLTKNGQGGPLCKWGRCLRTLRTPPPPPPPCLRAGSHAVWTHEPHIAQCPQIHTSQFSLEWMLSVLCMPSMWCQCILCTTSCACRLCVYCVYNVPVSGTASQYMLLCMHIIAAREVLALVTALH